MPEPIMDFPAPATAATYVVVPPPAVPYVLVAEFRVPSEWQADALFERLQDLAREMGVDLVTAPWVTAEAYDALEVPEP